MNLELTEEEMTLIMERRMKAHTDHAYNQGLQDCYNIVAVKIPMGVQRDEVLECIKSLQRQ
jgi:hypothetical protein